MSVTVQRHRTIPMTKRESVSTSGSRLSLISNTSNQKHLDERDTKNSQSSTGRKRTKEVKRTDSYRRATERQSVYDDFGEYIPSALRQGPNSYVSEDSRQKYNTLPIRREDNNNVIDTSKTLNHKTKKDSPFVLRNSSVKSGTYPSPDTDDDQRSVQPERKKKSAFKRFKERLALTFTKDRIERNRRGDKQTQSKDFSATENRKSDRRKRHKSDREYTGKSQHKKQGGDKSSHISEGTLKRQNGSAKSQNSPEKIRKELNIFQSFRDSLRRKSPPEYRKQGSNDSSKRNSKELRTAEPQSSQSSSTANGSRQNSTYHQSSCDSEKRKHKTEHVGRIHHGTGRSGRNSSEIRVQSHEHKPDYNKKGQYRDRDPPFLDAATGSTRRVVDELEDTFEDSGNHTTEIFGAIIDPDSSRQYALGLSGRAVQGQRPRPDRSKLRLEGLRLCRPKSIEGVPHSSGRSSLHRRSNEITTLADVHQERRYNNLSPEVECDGPDYADGAVGSPEEEEALSELSDAYIDVDDQKKRVHNVARCLKIIADKIVEEKKRSVTEDEIVIALREIADEIDRTKFQGMNVPNGIPKEILPVMKNIIAAKTYTNFVHVIQQETGKTIGWEQVAWYTFLAQSALQITGVGRDVGRRVRSLAMKYFSSKIRPWVESRTYGWESIHEETDIESELD